MYSVKISKRETHYRLYKYSKVVVCPELAGQINTQHIQW